jgi:NAD(P)-dependent dehydrogenase (short-subunit alcohol dehydrogenase family)
LTTVSVVTGGAGAMGAACALALAPTVDVVLLTDLDQDRLGAVAERIGSAAGATATATVSTLAGDLGEPEVVDELVARARASGRLASLVHTAGVSPSMAPWEDILRVDLVATARLLDAFLPCAVAGSVAVCLASIAGHLGPFDPAMDELLDSPCAVDLASRFRALVGDVPDPGATYRLAKRGVIRLCERAAVTWGARGGRVVSVSPGLIDTAMGRLELENNPIKHWMADTTPVGGGRSDAEAVLPGLTADVADVTAFLCSDKAAFVSGCDIRVDGGLTAAMNAPTYWSEPISRS